MEKRKNFPKTLDEPSFFQYAKSNQELLFRLAHSFRNNGCFVRCGILPYTNERIKSSKGRE